VKGRPDTLTTAVASNPTATATTPKRGVPGSPRRSSRGTPGTRRQASGSYPDLGAYIGASAEALVRTPLDPPPARDYLERQEGRRDTVSHLLHKLLAFEPFASELRDAVGGERLKALNLVVAECEALYHDGELRVEAGRTGVRASPGGPSTTSPGCCSRGSTTA
jgi:hypothetical protein